jgi:NAD(P)-dependent dehydrogenase (short-subunit alcohol dehydrogenase family)
MADNNDTQQLWFITGASSGFGRALTEAALAKGDRVVGVARRTEALAGLVDSHPDRLEALRLDVTDAGAVNRAVSGVLDCYGQIDVLVNNAGKTHVGAAEETEEPELRSLFELHFFAPVALVRAVLPSMRARHKGAIVQMSSMGGQMSFAGFSAYSATKFALEGYSEALAGEVAPYGIRVLIVEPGAFRTELFDAYGASAETETYADTVGATRAMIRSDAGNQPGDPAKAATAILAALSADDPPLRLPLGADAVDAVVGHLDQVRAEIEAWEKVARSTALDEG